MGGGANARCLFANNYTDYSPFAGLSKRGQPRCVFMTGVSRNVTNYFPGVLCILHQLRALRSRVPLVIAVPAEEQAAAQALLDAAGGSSNVALVAWGHFPYEPRYTRHHQRRWKDTRVLDKLNILGAPFKRLVWLDTDVLIRRNVDELCGAEWDNVDFAAAYNSGHEPRTCFVGGDECNDCQHHGVHEDELCPRGCSYWVRK